MGNKQTAVEWQHIEIAKFMIDKSQYNNLHDILIEAKEMERQQIMDAVNATMIDDDLNAYEYFTETYE